MFGWHVVWFLWILVHSFLLLQVKHTAHAWKSIYLCCYWHPSGLQELSEVLVHASCSQLLQAVVAVDDTVSSHHHHPDAVGVLAKLAADGRAHNHVQAVVAATGVSVVMAGEDRLHSCAGEGSTEDLVWQWQNYVKPSMKCEKLVLVI